MKVTEIEQVTTELSTIKRPWALRRARQRFERAYVDAVMDQVDHDRAKAVKVLGISLASLKEKLRPGFGGR